MTKEKLDELWSSADPGNGAVPLDFVRVLLLECAKTLCLNCREGNPSEATKEPTRRVHKLSATYSESCRAPSFFIEGE